MIELGKANIMRSGSDVTVVGWGGQLRVLEKVMRQSRMLSFALFVQRHGLE